MSLLSLVVLFSLFTPVQAQSKESLFTDEELTAIQDHWNDVGYEKDIQMKMLEKIESGQLPDAMNPEKVNKVEISLDSGKANGDQKHYFPDGSYIIDHVEESLVLPNPGEMSIFSSGGVSKNVSVKRTNMAVSMTLKARITLVQGGYDFINHLIKPAQYQGIAGTASLTSYRIAKKYENASGPARAVMQVNHKLAGGIASSTFTLNLRVGKDKYWKET